MFPKSFIIKNEVRLRGLLSIAYFGKNNLCSVCNTKLRQFVDQSNKGKLCPNCGSLPRNRRLWNLLSNEFIQPNLTVLDFSPSRCLYRKLKKIETITYIATDLSNDFIAEHRYDITNLDLPDNQFDLIICYHILEHVIDDIKAMEELKRVLKPTGKILIQTPFKEGAIFENYTIVLPEERLKHFGQEDHVRIYSVKELKVRLEQVGFIVEVRDFKEFDAYLGILPETILVVSLNQISHN